MTVHLNSELIQENFTYTGPTRGGRLEAPAGPIVLQGDHGPVAYRNIWVRQ